VQEKDKNQKMTQTAIIALLNFVPGKKLNRFIL
jgi:hypothetical protein